MISIICPIYNEERYIAKCIDSILTQDFPHAEIEVFFIDGMSSDNTRSIVGKYANKYPFIYLLDNPQRVVPFALNIGIRASKGEVIIRLDAHASYPNNYVSALVSNLVRLKADNVGGVCQTLPTNNNAESVAIAEALSCCFGMGNSYFRIGATKERLVDTVPFGCFRRDIFDRIGLFDEELIRNQDDEFNGRIVKNGGKIYLIIFIMSIIFYGVCGYCAYNIINNSTLSMVSTSMFTALGLVTFIAGTYMLFYSLAYIIIFVKNKYTSFKYEYT
ncbi:MAG: glycosyltransferase family 2 protein, partial [Alistipes sp.]